MKKIFTVAGIICLVFIITACSGEESSKTSDDLKPSVSDVSENPSDLLGGNYSEEDSTAIVNSKLLSCGQIFSLGSLNYNIIGLRTETFEEKEILFIKMEIQNDGSENKNYEAISTLELYDEKGNLCENEVFAPVESGLYGNILPNGRLLGEVAFNITDRVEGDYVLHIGTFYEFSPAITIKRSDIGMTFAEQFGKSEPDLTYSDLVESDELTIKINDTSTVVDNGGQKLLLIDISVTNNGSESTDLFDGFYLDGVYSKTGSKLDRSLGMYWDYLNYAIEPGDTKNGVLAYKINDSDTEFYMVVAPDSSHYSQKYTLGFSAE